MKTTYSKRLKRMPAPSWWPIARRAHKWVTRPMPGPHPIKDCLPLVVVLRDILHLARTGEEAEHLVSEGLVLVDGRRVAEKRFPLGLMDVLALPKSQQYYRFLPLPGRGLAPHRIDLNEASFKLRKIAGKTSLKHGDVQLNFHDGAAWIVKVADARKPVEDVYKVGDSLRFNLKTGEVTDHVRLSPGAYVLITGGRNMGLHGRLDSTQRGTATTEPTVTVQLPNGGTIQTTLTNLFPVGSERPLIALPEVPQ
ncbi:MAG: 30S ribosomal protein S4e [Candidatus Bathyarchaeia archaeon]